MTRSSLLPYLPWLLLACVVALPQGARAQGVPTHEPTPEASEPQPPVEPDAAASQGADAEARSEGEPSLDDERARAHYLAGESHFADERWADAAREFTLAYQLSHRPEMLINMSRAHERDGALAESISNLETLLRDYPDTTYRLEAERRIALMRGKLDARREDPMPVSAPRKVPIWPPRPVTLVVGATALAAGVAALATGLRAHGIYGDLDERCPGGACEGGFSSDRERGQALARTSTGLTFAAVALAGATSLLWVMDVKREREQSLAFGINGAGATLRAKF